MANEAAGHTLQPTALVHEAWMRLGGSEAQAFQNRAHFFGAAAEAMRRILIEHARRRLAAKRGAGVEVVDLDGLEIASPVADDDRLLALNEALEKLASADPRKAELVKLRYFVGLNFEEAAAALGNCRAHGQTMVGLRAVLAHGRDAWFSATLINRTWNESGFVALRQIRVPGAPGFRLDVREAGARRRIGDFG